jgi:prophage maintenance system killer protein
VASAKNARPPGFPSLSELKTLNQQIHDDAGSPERFRLDQPAPLKDCLARARAAYADTPDGVIEAAALLAHGIAQAQSFFDGNRRTAFFATQAFLIESGYSALTFQAKSDHTLARYLNQVVEPAKGGAVAEPKKFEALFRRRLRRAQVVKRSSGV